MQRKGDKIKYIQRVSAFMRPKRNMIVPHERLHIGPWRIGALTKDLRLGVERAVQNAYAEIGHTDLIGIREAKSDAAKHFFFVFQRLPEFSAGVSARLLHQAQQLFFVHPFFSFLSAAAHGICRIIPF